MEVLRQRQQRVSTPRRLAPQPGDRQRQQTLAGLPSMPKALSSTASERVTIDGKFFRLGERKFCVKGLTYGPFAPDAKGETFGSPAQVVRDFQQIRELGPICCASIMRHPIGFWIWRLSRVSDCS